MPRELRWTSSGEPFAALTVGDDDATPVLCLHGFPDHPPSFVPFLEHLGAQGFRGIAPWMRGYAPSTLRGPFDVDHLAGDVLALADTVAPGRRVGLVGHDWGAVVAYQALLRAPERFFAAVTLSVPHPVAFLRELVTAPAQLRRSSYMVLFQLGPLADAIVKRNNFAFIERLVRAWSPSLDLPPADLAALKDCLRESMPSPLEYYRSIPRPLGAAMARVRAAAARPIVVPTLYLHGESDGCIRPGIAQRRYFAGPFEESLVHGAGHFLAMEKPHVIGERAGSWLTRYR